MKIYRRAEFLNLPPGTLYAKGEPWAFEKLHIKGATWPNCNDFLCMDLQSIESRGDTDETDRLEEMLQTGASYPLDLDCFGRDGCFEEEALFLVFDRADLEKLSALIEMCKRQAA